MKNKSLYKTLGIEEGATDAEIKRAYKVLAQRYHPDKNNGCNEALATFKRIQEAYDVLSDPERREQYDKTGETKKSNISQFAMSVLAAEFQKVIGMIASNGATHLRPVDVVERNITDSIKQAHQAIKEMSAEAEKLQKMTGRIKTKEGDHNLYDQILLNNVREIEHKRNQVSENAKVLEKALSMLETYEDTAPKEQVTVGVDWGSQRRNSHYPFTQV
jgi:curved DNA-binding protein CbpA